MSYDEVRTLLQMINIDLSDQYALRLFQVTALFKARLPRLDATHPASPQKCDKSADGRLDQEEIEVFCRELLRRPELDAVFTQYSANGCVLSTLDLRDFLVDQGEDASLIHAQSLILTYELNEWGVLFCHLVHNRS